jgi:branched-subunit amino acid transport protein
MSWAAILLLAAGAYGFKALGLVVLGPRAAGATSLRVAALLPAALLPALVAVQTFGAGRSLVLDARAAGLVAAGIAVWRRAPFIVVVILAAGVTAAIRAVSG